MVKEIDQLLDHYTYPQIAAILNERGLSSGEGKAFTSRFIARIQRSYSLMSRYDRLRKPGMLPGENPPRKAQGIKLSQRALTKVASQCIKEVQCEA